MKNITPKKILIFRSGAIGDVLMTTPLVKSIKKKYPDSKIYYLTGKWSSGVLRDNPSIDEIMEIDESIIFRKKIFELNKLVISLRKQKFDVAFILDKSKWFGLLIKLAGVPIRIGFDRNGEGKFNTKNIKYDGKKHEIDYYLELTKFIGYTEKNREMEIFTKGMDTIMASKLIDKIKNEGIIIGVSVGGASNPGQTFIQKRWPKKNYRELIKKLSESNPVILIGGKDDFEISKEVSQGLKNVYNFAGKTTLKESAELIKKCGIFVTHDSGPMHLAVAVKTPVIGIFGPTDYRRFGYDKGINKVVINKNKKCAPCYDIYGKNGKNYNYECMKNISAYKVLKIVNKKLGS